MRKPLKAVGVNHKGGPAKAAVVAQPERL